MAINAKFWTWAEKHRRKIELRDRQSLEYVIDHTIYEFKREPLEMHHNMHVTHAPRPPAPRPFQLIVTWVMSDGQEYRTFCPMNGQAEWQENPPYWVMENAQRISTIRYSFQYKDGGLMR